MRRNKEIKKRLIKLLSSAMALVIAAVAAAPLNNDYLFAGMRAAAESAEISSEPAAIESESSGETGEEAGSAEGEAGSNEGETGSTEGENSEAAGESEEESAENGAAEEETAEDESIENDVALLSEEDAPVDNVIGITSAEELIQFSQNYKANPGEFQEKTLKFAITGEWTNFDGFTSIGTAEAPFNGAIELTSIDIIEFPLDVPLFDYITDAVQTKKSDGTVFQIAFFRESGSDLSPLFANNVVPANNGEEAAEIPEWRIKIASANVDSQVEPGDFTGVIGTIGYDENTAKGASVNLEIEYDSSANVLSADGNAGLACGTMGAYTALTVSVSGENKGFEVTSKQGNAGGLVGEMGSGSSLTISSNFSTSGTISAKDGYAGGLVGYAEDADVDFGASTVNAVVSGTSAAGGVFGYYKNTAVRTISDFKVTAALSGGCSGGFFGILENSGEITIGGVSPDNLSTVTVTKTGDTQSDFGGFIGNYSSEILEKSLVINNCKIKAQKSITVNNYGGVIGNITSSSYVKLSNITAAATDCKESSRITGTFGGLVGYCDNGFIDAEEVAVDTGDFIGGGLIGELNGGVLRLSGTTDLSATKAVYNSSLKTGQIVGKRDRTLIYAADGWTLIRGTAVDVDDIGSWGEVLRFNDSNSFTEDSVLTVNEDHTVTVQSAVTTLGSISDFAKLALNIKLNTGSDNVALCFADTVNNSSVLLGKDITLTNNIDLTGTGITGLTRDDGIRNSSSSNNTANNSDKYAVYSGTLDGGGYTLTLAAGEAYGYRDKNGTPALITENGSGVIYRHGFNGLFSRTNGVTFKNITLSGSVTVDVRSPGYIVYAGGFSALHTGGALKVVENVTVDAAITLKGSNNQYSFAGGITTRVDEGSQGLEILIDKSTIKTVIETGIGCKRYIIGGAIGEISTTQSFSAIITNSTFSATVTDYSNEQENRTGILIGNISNFRYDNPGNRSVSLKNVKFLNAAVTSGSNNNEVSGALLGEAWNNVCVTIGDDSGNGITVENCTVTYNDNADNGYFAGLCTVATGYWQVYDVNIKSITVNGEKAKSFGMLVNKGVYSDWSKTFGLYLELKKEDALKITSADISLKDTAVFDELLATSTDTCNDLTVSGNLAAQNSRAVVSIPAKDKDDNFNVIMDGENCNTYQNKTDRAIANSNTRYYYNLDTIRENPDSDGKKLLLWSVYNYAYSNVKQYFANSISGNNNNIVIPEGDYNMKGLSFYPIDPTTGTKVSDGCKFTFYNSEIENGESGSGNTDNKVRSTLSSTSQHYLMHCGLFRNVSGSLTVSGAEFMGTIGAAGTAENPQGSGALICGTISGNSSESRANVSIEKTALSGVTVWNKGSYAPLLINTIGSNSTVAIGGVYTAAEAYASGAIAATSLIGTAGGDAADGISIVFSKIALDGRAAADINTELSSFYGTTKSIFSKSILLDSFYFPLGSGCSAIYNFKKEEDWNGETAVHKVTYGKEISNTVEYWDEENSVSFQRKYIDGGFTSPVSPGSTETYDFSGYLHYVGEPYTKGGNYHEVKVNYNNAVNLDVGCGTYNDPYIIENAGQLKLLATILNNSNPENDGVIINYHADNYKEWCSEDDTGSYHTVYKWNLTSGQYEKTEGTAGATITAAKIREALSTAYFKINNNVILPDSFIGIGKTTAFKGVICGAEGESRVTVTNKSTMPFIYQSAGSVVKNLDFVVEAAIPNDNNVANSKYLTDGGNAYFYGGVIGIVKGGDNIIDKVGVTITNEADIRVIRSNGSCYGNVAIGGYIGVLRYGSVIFRNMTEDINHRGITGTDYAKQDGNYITYDSSEANSSDQYKVMLFINPIIGRVIDGFAVTESDKYKSSEADSTMKNGVKNYSITDINKNSSEKITFGAFSSVTGKSGISTSLISIPDSQSMFLMGCIAMSGAGSAGTDGKYPLTNSAAKYSYGTGMMTRHGEYNNIGAVNEADYEDFKNDSFAVDSVPYVIYKYTAETAQNNSGTNPIKYPAKCITNNSCVYNMEFGQNVTYNLSEGFRGIGSINRKSEDFHMYLYGIEGNDAVINLKMRYNAYKRNDYDRYNEADNYRVGLGLFNALIQNKNTFTPDTPVLSDVISGFTISGYVDYEVYSTEMVSSSTPTVPTYEWNNSSNCAGGLAGTAGSPNENDNFSNANLLCNIKVENVNLNNLTVTSRCCSGGLFGASRGSIVRTGDTAVNAQTGKTEYINAVNADDINVNGEYSGGLIGYSRYSTLNIYGGLINNISALMIRSGGDFNNNFSAGGGVVGLAIYSNNIAGSVCINGVSVENGELKTRYENTYSFLGGIVGCCSDKDGHDVSVEINDVTVKNTEIGYSATSTAATSVNGGIIGALKKGSKSCSIVGADVTTDSGSYISGGIMAGGIVGIIAVPLEMDKCSVDNYTIISSGSNSYIEGVGGFFGKIENSVILSLTNSRLKDITLKREYSSSQEKPVGGLLGAVTASAEVNGYNILSDNVQIYFGKDTNISKNRIGDIAGYIASGCSLNLIGVSLQKNEGGSYTDEIVKGNSGYCNIIYSDYEGVCRSESANKTPSAINNDDADMGAVAFATINPAVNIDSVNFITGDGVSSTALNNILSGSGLSPYKNVNTEKENFNSNYSEKLSTFNTRTGVTHDFDFPVLVINDTNANITDLLNCYIRLLTNNSSYVENYAEPEDDKFRIVISSYGLDENGVFKERTGVENLKVIGGMFRMTDTYDSAYNDQFTLIDVQYLAPGDTSKVAYHLYIPVYVEKMLKFDFKIAALSGTRYNSVLYDNPAANKDIYGLPVLENYGTPVTAYVTYSYLRTAAEWQDAINNGEKLIGSYGKSVILDQNYNTFPNNTKIALVDRNNCGKAYYSVINATDRTLNFGDFTAFDGETTFSPVSFCELLEKSADIVAEVSANGTLVECTESDPNATVKISGTYYRKKTDEDTDKDFYSVTVTPKSGMTAADNTLIVEESYYLSFFTNESNSFPVKNILISCAGRLGDSGMTPSRMNNTGSSQKEVHVILGNLYNQSITFKTTGSEVINDDNRTISAELEAIISLKEESASDVKYYLGSKSIYVYQGFIIEAVKTDEGATEKGIKGSPRVYGSYTVEGDEYTFDFSNTDSVISITGTGQNGAVDIKSYLKNSGSVTISADLKISYDDDTSVIEQFPERKTESSTNGVTYSAASNLAYVEDNIGQSNISSESADLNNKKYYRDNISTVSLNYDIPALMPNELTNCGVNGLETNGEITAVGYYNVANVPEADLNRAEKVKLTLSLYQKDNEKVYNQVDIDQYLTDVKINGNKITQTTAADKNVYSVELKKSDLKLEANSFEIPTSYSVITGDEFEQSRVKMYANYKVKLEAQLLDSGGGSIDNTICSDYIIYTNAKIYTDMITAG